VPAPPAPEIDGRPALAGDWPQMVTKKASPGRPRTGRAVQGRGALVRFSREEYEIIQRAIAIQTEGVVGGSAVTVAAFARHAALGVAQRILHDAEGEKLPQA